MPSLDSLPPEDIQTHHKNFAFKIALVVYGFLNDAGFLLFLNACITIAKGGTVASMFSTSLKSSPFLFEPNTFAIIFGVWLAMHIFLYGIVYNKGKSIENRAALWLPAFVRVFYYFCYIRNNPDKNGSIKNQIWFLYASIVGWTFILLLIAFIPQHTALVSIFILGVVFCVGMFWVYNRLENYQDVVSFDRYRDITSGSEEYNECLTILHWAVINDHLDAIQYLLITGKMQINKPTKTGGFSALSLAAQRGHEHAARLLLEYEADANHRTDAGMSPYNLAKYMGHTEVVTLLKNHGVEEAKWQGVEYEEESSETEAGSSEEEGTNVYFKGAPGYDSDVSDVSELSLTERWSDVSDVSELSLTERGSDVSDVSELSLTERGSDVSAPSFSHAGGGGGGRRRRRPIESTGPIAADESTGDDIRTTQKNRRRKGGSVILLGVSASVLSCFALTCFFRKNINKKIGIWTLENMQTELGIAHQPELGDFGNLIHVTEMITTGEDLNAYVPVSIRKSSGGIGPVDSSAAIGPVDPVGGGRKICDREKCNREPERKRGGVGNDYDLFTENLPVEKYLPPFMVIPDVTVADKQDCKIIIHLVTPSRFAVWAEDLTGKLLYALLPNGEWGTKNFDLILNLCTLSFDKYKFDKKTTLLTSKLHGPYTVHTASMIRWTPSSLYICEHGLLLDHARDYKFVPFVQSTDGYVLETPQDSNKYWLTYSTNTVNDGKIHVRFTTEKERKNCAERITEAANQWLLQPHNDGIADSSGYTFHATKVYKDSNISSDFPKIVNNTGTTISNPSNDIDTIQITPRNGPRGKRWFLCFQVLPYPFNYRENMPFNCAILIDSSHVYVSRNLIDWLKAAAQDRQSQTSDISVYSRRERKYGVFFTPNPNKVLNCSKCLKQFSILKLKLRHHCRVCGHVFCQNCVKTHRIKYGVYNIVTNKKSVCKTCIDILDKNLDNPVPAEEQAKKEAEEKEAEEKAEKIRKCRDILFALTPTLLRLAYPNGNSADCLRKIKHTYNSRMKGYAIYDTHGQEYYDRFKTEYSLKAKNEKDRNTFERQYDNMMFRVDIQSDCNIMDIPANQSMQDFLSKNNFQEWCTPIQTRYEIHKNVNNTDDMIDVTERAKIFNALTCGNTGLWTLPTEHNITDLHGICGEQEEAQEDGNDLSVSIAYHDKTRTFSVRDIHDPRLQTLHSREDILEEVKVDGKPFNKPAPKSQLFYYPVRPHSSEMMTDFPHMILSLLTNAMIGPSQSWLDIIKQIIKDILQQKKVASKPKQPKLPKQPFTSVSAAWSHITNMVTSSKSMLPSNESTQLRGGKRTRAMVLYTRPRTYQKRALPVHSTTQRVKTQRHSRRIPCVSLRHTRRRYMSHPRKRTRTSISPHHATIAINAQTCHRRRAGGTQRVGARQHGGRRRSRGR